MGERVNDRRLMVAWDDDAGTASIREVSTRGLREIQFGCICGRKPNARRANIFCPNHASEALDFTGTYSDAVVRLRPR